NLLAIALCLLVLDDGVWPRFGRRHPQPEATSATPALEPERVRRWPAPVVRIVSVAVILTSLVPTLRALHAPIRIGPVEWLYGVAAPFRTVNSYGLFSIMTTRRNEIVIEGSDDGVSWLPYEFRYKP